MSGEEEFRPIDVSLPTAEIGMHNITKVQWALNQHIDKATSIADLLKKTRTEIAQVKKHHPDFPEEQIDAELDFVFNFLLLDQIMLENNNELPTLEQKEMSARLQHHLTHRIIHTSSEYASDEDVSLVYDVIFNSALRISRADRKWTSGLAGRWAGLRNELAVIRVLLEGGYKVFLPNYTQDSLSTDTIDNQVVQLDVKNGIDAVIVNPESGDYLLVDFKGTRLRDIPKNAFAFRTGGYIRSIDNKHCLNNVLSSISGLTKLNIPPVIPQAKIYIPTEGQSFVLSNIGIKYAETNVEKRAQINNFGRLKEHVADAILFDVKNLSNSRPHV